MVEFASVPFKTISPISPEVSRTKSAVKSCPESSSSIKTCLASLNWNVVIVLTVKSVLPEFSIIPPVSEESDAINFSPLENVPLTPVR